MSRIAIIGTGITGLSIAHHCNILRPQSLVTLFDKSRRPGGRISTRSTRTHPSFFFDHGVPLILQDHLSNNLKETLLKLDAIKLKTLRVLMGDYASQPNALIIEKGGFVGRKGIESIPTQIHKSLKVQTHFQQRISAIAFKQDRYFLDSQTKQHFGPYDQVFCCIPLPQANAITKIDCDISSEVEGRYQPIWTLMLAIKTPLFQRQFDYGLNFNNQLGVVGFMRQNFKVEQEGRPKEDLWVFQMGDHWSSTYKDLKPEEVEQKFIQIVSKTLKMEEFQKHILHLKAHRWLYGQPLIGPLEEIVSTNGRLVLAGDWVNCTGTIGCSWQLGRRVAEKYLSSGQSKL